MVSLYHHVFGAFQSRISRPRPHVTGATESISLFAHTTGIRHARTYPLTQHRPDQAVGSESTAKTGYGT